MRLTPRLALATALTAAVSLTACTGESDPATSTVTAPASQPSVSVSAATPSTTAPGTSSTAPATSTPAASTSSAAATSAGDSPTSGARTTPHVEITSITKAAGITTIEVTTKPGATFALAEAGTTITPGKTGVPGQVDCTITKRTPGGLLLESSTVTCDNENLRSPRLIVTIPNQNGHEAVVMELKQGRLR